jgi:hypothetical protein
MVGMQVADVGCRLPTAHLTPQLLRMIVRSVIISSHRLLELICLL